ncbi:bifunctional diguanylate cyclase/phosphodiesterase [Salmonella enterica subsp. enterica]|nr:bifunctional diguanylate cyclase/phosphodiesterase [Salmonella enterica subsp. enterica serovar Enteritidis]MIL09164.1 bifunctional diguanylate cyclase/phosphodiesterase [Salmonella enterica subsp. enterica serovar Enteritidis]
MMTADSLISRPWLLVRFAVILAAAATFHLVIHGDLQDQRRQMAERGFVSPRLEEISRVEKEFSEVFEMSRRYVEPPRDVELDDVKLALDILWSRVNSIMDKTRSNRDAYGKDVDIGLIERLNADLPGIEAAVAQLRPEAIDSKAPLEAYWISYRRDISEFGDAAYGARIRILQDNNLSQWQLFAALKKYQLAFSAYGLLLTLLLLAELLWANRVVSRLKASNRHNEQLANTDHLTGLYNRRSLDHELANRIATCKERPFCAIAVDIDRFRTVNDSFGHVFGDRLLVETGWRIRRTVKDGYVSRMSGDEFIVLVCGGEETAAALAQRISSAMAAPMSFGDRLYHPSVSISVVAGAAGVAAGGIIQAANAGILEAKSQNGGQIVLFRDGMMRAIRERAIVESDLPDAIRSDAISIVVQPKVRLDDRSVHGFEALARWQHPELGWVSPELFCGIADAAGLSSPLGLKVTGLALEATVAARAQGHGGRMSINVSPAFGSHPTFVADMQNLLAEHGLAASDIEFEVTEDAMLSATGAVRDNILAMRELGASVAIDDFGKGHSNMARLSGLPVSVLKVDKSVIGEGVEERATRAIIKGLVQVAAELDIELLVEGVETEDQARTMQELGVDTAQGYLFARPMSPLRLLTWLADHAGPRSGAPVASRVVA